LRTHVACKQNFFEILVKIVVENTYFEKFFYLKSDVLLSLFQTVDYFFEKSHIRLLRQCA